MQKSMPKAAGEDDDLMEDDSDDDLDLGSVSGEEGSGVEDDEDDNSDALSLMEASDNEDLISLDGEVPDGLIEYDGSDAGEEEEQEEWGGIGEGTVGGQKRKREETRGGKRKKLKSLPTFASYEDYAKMIEDGPEDDI
jgi:ribosome biogenesis protein MAK21